MKIRKDLYKQLVWDYNLSQEEFEKILLGKAKKGKFDQSWAIARVLENLDYYEAMEMVPLKVLKENWKRVQGKLFNQSIKKGYEFVLQR